MLKFTDFWQPALNLISQPHVNRGQGRDGEIEGKIGGMALPDKIGVK